MGQWLSRQHRVKAGDNGESFKLVETRSLDHVEMREDNKFYTANRISISESGMIGISCDEKPSLSVIYPGKDKSPTVLSNDKIYRSATFVKVSGKEYMAAACDEDGCLYLWDIQSKTSTKVFDPMLSSEPLYKKMNIFEINENTIGYGEVFYSQPDTSRRVFILKTDTQELTLSSTLRIFTPDSIWDMCYVEVDGGTPCLLLCIPHDHLIMAVEMIGGRTRWQVRNQQMGEEFKPWSICTDQNDRAYVADFSRDKIYLVSASDGSVLKQFDSINLGICNIFTVRFHEEHLYVEHVPLVPSQNTPSASSKKAENTENYGHPPCSYFVIIILTNY